MINSHRLVTCTPLSLLPARALCAEPSLKESREKRGEEACLQCFKVALVHIFCYLSTRNFFAFLGCSFVTAPSSLAVGPSPQLMPCLAWPPPLFFDRLIRATLLHYALRLGPLGYGHPSSRLCLVRAAWRHSRSACLERWKQGAQLGRWSSLSSRH